MVVSVGDLAWTSLPILPISLVEAKKVFISVPRVTRGRTNVGCGFNVDGIPGTVSAGRLSINVRAIVDVTRGHVHIYSGENPHRRSKIESDVPQWIVGHFIAHFDSHGQHDRFTRERVRMDGDNSDNPSRRSVGSTAIGTGQAVGFHRSLERQI